MPVARSQYTQSHVNSTNNIKSKAYLALRIHQAGRRPFLPGRSPSTRRHRPRGPSCCCSYFLCTLCNTRTHAREQPRPTHRDSSSLLPLTFFPVAVLWSFNWGMDSRVRWMESCPECKTPTRDTRSFQFFQRTFSKYSQVCIPNIEHDTTSIQRHELDTTEDKRASRDFQF